MILSVGEILADVIGGSEEKSAPEYKMFIGGAPFNVAVNAAQAGAEVGFIGRVGKDPVGKFLIKRAKAANLAYLDVQLDEIRNTTLAFVTLADGERDFAFFRHDTADFNIDAEKIDLTVYKNLDIVHLGSLMLSEKRGRELADRIIEKTRAAGKTLSFDVNFRLDLYGSVKEAVCAYMPYVAAADILKFSEDEIKAFTGECDLESAAAKVYKKGSLLLITLGSNGSMYVYNDMRGIVETEKVKPVDTTGAGDAFFGAVLANLDGKNLKTLTREEIENALAAGNRAGAAATQFMGAVKL